MRPVTSWKAPKAVPRDSAPTRSETRAFSVPSVRPEKRAYAQKMPYIAPGVVTRAKAA